MITVFTPTYNRAHTLPSLYRSLLEQTNTDFEWLIIDDGSTDATKELIAGFIAQNKIAILHKRVSNGGKHRGHQQSDRTGPRRVFLHRRL